MAHNFEKLRIYQDSVCLAKNTYNLFKKHPNFAIRDQVLKSVIFVSSNIAEGSQRNSEKDFVKFLYCAKGSAAELFTQLNIIGKDDGIDAEILDKLIDDSRNSMIQIQAFINHLNKN